MKLFEEKYGTLEYDSTVPCITASFIGFMSSEQFRAFLNKGLDYLIEKKQHHDKNQRTKKHCLSPSRMARGCGPQMF